MSKKSFMHLCDELPRIKDPIQPMPSDRERPYYNVLPYYGGKFFQLPRTLPFIELVAKENQATTYMELFGGGGKCIVNLDRIDHLFQQKIYNEWDKGLCYFMALAANPTESRKLTAFIRSLEGDRKLFNYCKKNRLNEDASPLEIAAMTYISVRGSFGNQIGNSYSRTQMAMVHTSCKAILEAPKHLENVQVRCGDYRPLLEQYGADKKVVKYLDPPYHPECRNQSALKVYAKEMEQSQQKEMVELLCQSRAWVLSGYDPIQYGCEDYLPLEKAGAKKLSIGQFRLKTSVQANKTKEEFIWYKI